MKISPLAGKLAKPAMLVNVPKLITAYYTEAPDPAVPAQRVAFGTSGHRGQPSIKRSMKSKFSPSLKPFASTATRKKLTAPCS